KDKTEFLIFDLCSNFDYFSQEIPEADPKLPDSLTARLVKARLGLIKLIPTEDPIIENRDLRRSLLDDLHQHVTSMERNNFLVRPHLQQVEEFSQRDRWESLSDPDITTISDTLAPLPNGLPRENRLVKEFDLLCLKLQLSILQQSPDFVTLRDRVRDISHSLEAKRDIPMVKAQLTLIEEVQVESWWEDATLESIEYIRKNLRELVKFIDRQQQNIIYTDFIDELGEITDVNVPIQQTGFSPYQYRKKVETYIRNNENHVAIAKLKRNLPLTEADLDSLETMLFAAEEIESRDRFEQVFGKDLSLKIFIRKLVGLDRQAAKQAFSQYLEGNNYTGNQIRFIETIIDYLTQNGIIDPKLLYEPPFTDLHYEGLDGVFDDSDADNIFSIVCSFNRPRIPNYRKKRGLYQVTFPAQAVSYDEYESTCKLAISRECKPELINKEIVIPGGSSFSSEQLAEVRIVPSCGKLWVEYVYKSEIETAKGLDFRHALGIDPGVSNWLTAVSTKGRSFIVCGRKIKSINQRYNKAVAKYKKGKSDFYWDERLDEITHKRNCQIRDSVNKAARFIINYCLNHDIGNIVFGWGQRIKTSSNLGKRNNQNFIQIPTARLKNRIKELAESLGIIFTETEESYTSKSSFLDGDLLPKYGEKADATEPSSHGGSQAHQAPSQYEFSGKRITRGTYKTVNGWLISADVNGAANILKKVAIQLKLSLAEVGRGILTVPKRYDLSCLKKSYRKRYETRLQPVS
ncbi:MAG: RNA-guided endonuclease TnpB family protein, partial [Prochloraceae cyanobacterium]